MRAPAALTVALIAAGLHAVTAGCGQERPIDPHPAPLPVADRAHAAGRMDERVVLVVDVDETISATDYGGLFLGRDGSRPLDGAAATLHALAADFDILYLTARPLPLFEQTRAWVRRHGFPPAPVLTSARVADVVWHGPFKTRVLAALRTERPAILLGIGDKPSDAQAYAANHMLPLIVHPPPGAAFPPEAQIVGDWAGVAAFVAEHAEDLRDPQRLMAKFAVGAPPPHPQSAPRLAPSVWLPLELLAAAPALLVEDVLTLEPRIEQRQARRALAVFSVDMTAALERFAQRFEADHILKLGIERRRGAASPSGDGARRVDAVWEVRYVRGGQGFAVDLDGESGAFAEERRVRLGWGEQAVLRRPIGLSAADALRRALREAGGQAYELELEMDGGVPTYEVAVMAWGRFLEVEMHAGTGEVIEVEDETVGR